MIFAPPRFHAFAWLEGMVGVRRDGVVYISEWLADSLIHATDIETALWLIENIVLRRIRLPDVILTPSVARWN